MMNYYDETLIKIATAIKKADYNAAYTIILDELSMPYIPQKYIKEFSDLKNEVSQYISEHKSKKGTNFDKYTIFKILNSKDDLLAPIAANQLKELNLRDCLDQIERLFLNIEIKNTIKVVVFEYLIQQDINIKLSINTKFDHLLVKTDKSLILTNDYQKLMNLIEDNLNKNPSLLEICNSYVNKFLINLFPITYIYEQDDELIFVNIASKALSNNQILGSKHFNKSLFINNIIKRHI